MVVFQYKNGLGVGGNLLKQQQESNKVIHEVNISMKADLLTLPSDTGYIFKIISRMQ